MRIWLSLVLSIFCLLAVEAKVAIYAAEEIYEKTELLVKGNDLRNFNACIWMEHSDEKSSACDPLHTRVNKDRNRAKIYLPEVSKDTKARLVVASGLRQTEQEFMITIKDLYNPKKNILSHFKFFTRKEKDHYAMTAEKIEKELDRAKAKKDQEPEEPEITAASAKAAPGTLMSGSLTPYAAQKLTFNKKNEYRRDNTRSRIYHRYHKTRFHDVLSLKPLPEAPKNPQIGDMYLNLSNAFCIFMEGKWQKIIGSGLCN